MTNKPYDTDQLIPEPGLYTEYNRDDLEKFYSDKRLLTTSVLMYCACEELQMDELKVKWLYKSIEYQQREPKILSEHAILQKFYPALLRKGDVENAIYVCQVGLRATELARMEKETVRDTKSLLFLLQLIPMLLYANQQILKNKDITAFERVRELFDGVNEDESEFVPIAKELLSLPISEVGPSMYHKHERCKDFPLYETISTLLFTKEEAPITHAFISMCLVVRNCRPSCENYYNHELDWVFDDFVVAYWDLKVATTPTGFTGLDHYKQKGRPKIDVVQTNKAKECLRLLSFHVKDLKIPDYIEDWLYAE